MNAAHAAKKFKQREAKEAHARHTAAPVPVPLTMEQRNRVYMARPRIVDVDFSEVERSVLKTFRAFDTPKKASMLRREIRAGRLPGVTHARSHHNVLQIRRVGSGVWVTA